MSFRGFHDWTASCCREYRSLGGRFPWTISFTLNGQRPKSRRKRQPGHAADLGPARTPLNMTPAKKKTKIRGCGMRYAGLRTCTSNGRQVNAISCIHRFLEASAGKEKIKTNLSKVFLRRWQATRGQKPGMEEDVPAVRLLPVRTNHGLRLAAGVRRKNPTPPTIDIDDGH